MENQISENSTLLPSARNSLTRKGYSFPKIRCCVESKAACLILLWNFAILLGYIGLYDIKAMIQVSKSSWIIIITYGVVTVIAIFSPMAGLLTDIRFSRYKAILCSSYVIIAHTTTLFLVIIFIFIAASSSIISLDSDTVKGKSFVSCIVIYIAIFAITYIVFIVNGIQFGMDQLHASPTEDSILYIHWYVWIYYTCSLTTEIPWNLMFYNSWYLENIKSSRLQLSGLCIAALILLTIMLLFTVSLCAVRYRKEWFLFEPAGVNPYKLVYRVVQFAYQHKIPLRHSAFTYCDEESQTRLDVGKHKFGGPFTTKQVEDVKAFWGILKVLISIGPAFLLQTVMQSLLPLFSKHGNIFRPNPNSTGHVNEVHLEGITRYILISNGLLSPLLVVICIPFYLFWIRQRILYHIPGMLRRIGLAILLMTISLSSTFLMDVMVHVNNTDNSGCMFKTFTKLYPTDSDFIPDAFLSPPLYQNMYFFITQHVLSALTDMVFDIAVLEFICSQSPYSMKGLLLGIFFSIRSLFQAISIISVIPFGTVWKIESLSCGSGFYAMYIVIGLLEFVLFSCVSKRYKYRDMNEPSNEYRYAEEYYSNIPQILSP